MIQSNTRIDKLKIGKNVVYVKREDLCVPEGSNWPRFAKIRGLQAHAQKLKAKGIEIIAYPDNKISMAGWGVAAVSKEVGLKAIIFHHNYIPKNFPPKLAFHIKKWQEFGAEVIPLKGSVHKILGNAGAKYLKENFGGKAVMLPIGLKFSETVAEVANEAKLSNLERFKSIVVCVGSGMMCSGILKALPEESRLYAIMVKHLEEGKLDEMRDEIVKNAGLALPPANFELINSDYEYEQKAKCECPFPCHPIYDLKAWDWLNKNIQKLKPPVLFWDVGADSY
jgi:1-aminocyclopropane-1-carboxylate deaminase/D-cysteine desulfhydrase-like pyridoxal-dependent ACC family enzyme